MNPDPEIRALQVIAAALDTLDVDTVNRVMWWLTDRYGVGEGLSPERRESAALAAPKTPTTQDGDAMSQQITVMLHNIEQDGLPTDADHDVGSVAFIFDGCIVSGWHLGYGPDHDRGYSGEWEANSDVGRHGPFHGVTHWVHIVPPLRHLVAAKPNQGETVSGPKTPTTSDGGA